MDDSPPISSLSGLLDGLTRIDERLARMERRLDQLERISELPNFVAMITDTLDQHANQLRDHGVNLEERAQTALALLERITEPGTAHAVSTLLELAEQAPNAIAMLVDSIDARAAALGERIDLSQRAVTLARVAERLTSPAALSAIEVAIDHLPAIEQLLSAGMLGPGPIDIVSRAGQALSHAQQSAPRAVGLFGLLRALSDPDVQHTLGFAIAFARELGHNLAPLTLTAAVRALPKTSERTPSI